MARSQKKLQILDGICLDVWKLKPPSLHINFKVAYRVHIWKKKHFVKIVTSFAAVLLKITLCLCFIIFTLYLQKTHYFKLI